MENFLIRHVRRTQELNTITTIKNKMATNKKINAFILGDKLVKHGDVVKARWAGWKGIHDVYIYIDSRGRTFAFQNEREGSAPPEFYGNRDVNKGYTCSWAFTPGDTWDDFIIIEDELPNKVPALPTNAVTPTRTFDYSGGTLTMRVGITRGYDSVNMDFLKPYNIIKDTRFDSAPVQRGTSDRYNICTGQGHPDCCGARLLYNWSTCREGDGGYNPYRFIEDSDLPIIKEKLGLGKGAAKLAHLADYQFYSIQLAERLGFRRVHSYRNRNSGNTVHLYQYD